MDFEVYDFRRQLQALMALIVLVLSSVTGRTDECLNRYQYTQLHMGVAVRLVVYAPDEAMAARACEAAFHRVAELEEIMSDYRPSSELSRLCARAGGAAVAVSDELFFILQRALELSRLSDGAFDVTVGAYVSLWRIARQTGRLPSDEERRRASKLVGWRNLRLDPKAKTVQLLVPRMRLDVGGIAKGYAGDCALAVLKRHGITRALFEAGGDIVVSGAPPGRRGWTIELFNAESDSQVKTLTLVQGAVSTSGDTEQFIEFNGKRYSHILDPSTGLGLTNRIAVTVVARDGITADSLATAVSVLGSQKGQALVKSFPSARVYIHHPSDD